MPRKGKEKKWQRQHARKGKEKNKNKKLAKAMCKRI